ncbi:MAG: glycosyltransferase, partial [Candidatus Paceibacteria bacterium]
SSTNHVHTIHNCEWGFSKGIYSTFHRHFLTQICDKLTVPSPYTASIASSHIWGEKKPVVIPNGVDIDRFKPDNSESISKRVLYIGRIANRKHPEMVVDLAQQMSEYTFHARIKNIEKRPDLYERVKDEPNVKLLGQLSISEIAE